MLMFLSIYAPMLIHVYHIHTSAHHNFRSIFTPALTLTLGSDRQWNSGDHDHNATEFNVHSDRCDDQQLFPSFSRLIISGWHWILTRNCKCQDQCSDIICSVARSLCAMCDENENTRYIATVMEMVMDMDLETETH